MFSRLPVRRIEAHPLHPAPQDAWPFVLPPVRQLLHEGLDLGPVTILTGENGSGKSTLTEALAMAFGLNAEGGSTGAMHTTNRTESGLHEHLQLVRGAGTSKRGFFLRAESMHSFFTYLQHLGTGAEFFHEQSHGESFLDLLDQRSRVNGLWVLDEPEAALSLSGCLGLLSRLQGLVERGSQVVLSTHSPILAAFPGATLLEVGPWGLRASGYDELDLVRGWRSFLDAPERFLRHLD
jgi:predicted ATPase